MIEPRVEIKTLKRFKILFKNFILTWNQVQ